MAGPSVRHALPISLGCDKAGVEQACPADILRALTAALTLLLWRLTSGFRPLSAAPLSMPGGCPSTSRHSTLWLAGSRTLVPDELGLPPRHRSGVCDPRPASVLVQCGGQGGKVRWWSVADTVGRCVGAVCWTRWEGGVREGACVGESVEVGR